MANEVVNDEAVYMQCVSMKPSIYNLCVFSWPQHSFVFRERRPLGPTIRCHLIEAFRPKAPSMRTGPQFTRPSPLRIDAYMKAIPWAIWLWCWKRHLIGFRWQATKTVDELFEVWKKKCRDPGGNVRDPIFGHVPPSNYTAFVKICPLKFA